MAWWLALGGTSQSDAGTDAWNKGKCKLLSARPSAHNCPHPDLLRATARSNRECRRNQKEKLCFQKNLNLSPVFQRVMRCTYHNYVYSLEGSMNATDHGYLHRETKGGCSPARVGKGQSLRVKKIQYKCDITSYIISWPNLRSWISSNQN